MAVRPSTTLVMDTQQGGMQVGDNNNISYSNCHITNITHVHNNCKQCHPTEEHDVTQDASRDLRSTSTVHTTTSVRLVDSEGRELELEDVVLFDNTALVSIYAGDGMNIMQDEETGKIVLEPINVEEHFTSFPFFAGQKYSGRQALQRAKGKVGQVFHGHYLDFVCWCCCGMTFTEWIIHKGLQDTAPFARYVQQRKAGH
ncbi:uncharacterized protein LOC125371675 [Haliotis rufescens]|uniref:uncharacterized protein LOC125371675 n=1 Tax=Haliotis rufescens TaxID=6454 RepID=UPI00201EE8FA|nr:uncharacterized protein LOC125371675 [Haliotis rufescens]